MLTPAAPPALIGTLPAPPAVTVVAGLAPVAAPSPGTETACPSIDGEEGAALELQADGHKDNINALISRL
jgi:hypothetical protein